MTTSPNIEKHIQSLEEARHKGEDVFLDTLARCAKDKGMVALAQQTGLDRSNLYRSLRAGSKPRYMTIHKILSALGIEQKLVSKRE